MAPALEAQAVRAEDFTPPDGLDFRTASKRQHVVQLAIDWFDEYLRQ